MGQSVCCANACSYDGTTHDMMPQARASTGIRANKSVFDLISSTNGIQIERLEFDYESPEEDELPYSNVQGSNNVNNFDELDEEDL